AAEPAHQPWRGVGNLNLNRFDRTKAVEVVAGWSEALKRLLQHVELLSATSSWEELYSPSDVSAAATVITDLPEPEPQVEEKLVALATGDAARKSLDEWANRCMRVHDLEVQVDGICSRQALEANSEAADALIEKATTFDAVSLPLDEISK